MYEWVSHSHEIEFVYEGITYMVQPEGLKGKSWLVIWECSDSPKFICRHEIPETGDIPKEIMDSVLSEKCFNGKSFLEFEKDVKVGVIFLDNVYK